MSSPRRAAKDALRARRQTRRAARGQRRRQTKTSTKIAVADAKRVGAAIERGIADGKLDMLRAEALQALMAAACRLYRRAARPASNSRRCAECACRRPT